MTFIPVGSDQVRKASLHVSVEGVGDGVRVHRFVEMDNFFCSASKKLYEESDKPFDKDWLLDFKMFRFLIKKLAKMKYPLAPTIDDSLRVGGTFRSPTEFLGLIRLREWCLC